MCITSVVNIHLCRTSILLCTFSVNLHSIYFLCVCGRVNPSQRWGFNSVFHLRKQSRHSSIFTKSFDNAFGNLKSRLSSQGYYTIDWLLLCIPIVCVCACVLDRERNRDSVSLIRVACT